MSIHILVPKLLKKIIRRGEEGNWKKNVARLELEMNDFAQDRMEMNALQPCQWNVGKYQTVISLLSNI